MLTQEIPECPFPSLTKNGQLKKATELFEKKVRVRVEEVGAGYAISRVVLGVAELKFQPWPPGLWPGEGACYPTWYLCLTKTKRKDTFLSCVVRSAVIVNLG